MEPPANASQQFNLEREHVLRTVERNGGLNLFSKKFSDDKEIVLAAVRHSGAELNYASPRLQNDKDVVLAAVKRSGIALMYASKELQADRDVALQALIDLPSSLEYTSNELRSDVKFMEEAMNHHPLAFYFSLSLDGVLIELVYKSKDKDLIEVAEKRLRRSSHTESEISFGDLLSI